ncbi:MAG: 6-carboxytetrahydropterin synthase [Ignavibacteriales bacterium]|nr:6-carboxytetrahydropterin synthase [Ignavibacteriales bacterium]
MKIAKEFTWEMGHRLPFHKGKCVNLHGHSYKAIVAFEGKLDDNGMLIDFYDVKQIVNPVIESLDHAFVVHKDDTEVLEYLTKLGSKTVVLDFHSTAENLCIYLLGKIKDKLTSNISTISVRLYETDDAYAEETLVL